jgi:VIT1/CCC1 family predicted Fe2+/Mn2+ transporter
VASASSGKSAIMVAGLAGLVAGAMSMAAGEYVSVSSQADTEAADIAKESADWLTEPPGKLVELAQLYQQRGLTPALALEVARQMMSGDALLAHTRDELGISPALAANPIQACLVSAATFASGAALPLLIAMLIPESSIVMGVSLATLVALVALVATGAWIGGAGVVRGAARVTFGERSQCW